MIMLREYNLSDLTTTNGYRCALDAVIFSKQESDLSVQGTFTLQGWKI